MDLNFIGIGGAFNVELGCNCAYIKENRKILFLDFGLDTFEKVLKYNVLDDVDSVSILITHLHGDHIGGLPTFIDYCYFGKNIIVEIVDNSPNFTNKLVKILEITDVLPPKYKFIKVPELDFSFEVSLFKTTHAKNLECYSVVFDSCGEKTLFTSDSNDIKTVEKCLKSAEFTRVYSEVGEGVDVHMEYELLKKIKNGKLVLMHIQSMDLYNRALKDGFKVPTYLK